MRASGHGQAGHGRDDQAQDPPLPVISEGVLCGIVSIGDVVKNRLEEMETETNILREVYIART